MDDSDHSPQPIVVRNLPEPFIANPKQFTNFQQIVLMTAPVATGLAMGSLAHNLNWGMVSFLILAVPIWSYALLQQSSVDVINYRKRVQQALTGTPINCTIEAHWKNASSNSYTDYVCILKFTPHNDQETLGIEEMQVDNETTQGIIRVASSDPAFDKYTPSAEYAVFQSCEVFIDPEKRIPVVLRIRTGDPFSYTIKELYIKPRTH